MLMLHVMLVSRCRRIAVPFLLCLLVAPLLLSAQETPADPTSPADLYAAESYTLVWADEFERDGKPDPAKWTYERGFVRNEEAQWYQEENANCSDGMLVIEARREKVGNPRYRAGSKNWQTSREFAEYTSSCLITKGLHSWTHGRFEMRGRIDTRTGIWPAWWTLGVEGRWPAGGEIDIMEYYRNMLLANVAWQGRQPDGRRFVQWDDLKLPLNELGDGWPSQFHVWRMDWDETRIELSVDGRVLNTTDLKDAVNPDGTQPAQPFQQPHYMLLNLAIGGANGGDPSATEFPARFEVDYVRVYQRQPPTQPKPPQPTREATPQTAIPEPPPVKTDLLIGTHPLGLPSLATDASAVLWSIP
jgi:beta-glucanase (GH16 family)